MPADVVRIFSIHDALREFLEWRSPTLEPEIVGDYRECIRLLEASIDQHGSRRLEGLDRAVFRSHYISGRGYRRRFCEVFGPEKIPGEVRYFLQRFLRRADTDPETVSRAPTVVADLCAWLVWRGYVDDDTMENAIDDLRPRERHRRQRRARHGGRA